MERFHPSVNGEYAYRAAHLDRCTRLEKGRVRCTCVDADAWDNHPLYGAREPQEDPRF